MARTSHQLEDKKCKIRLRIKLQDASHDKKETGHISGCIPGWCSRMPRMQGVFL